MRTSLKLIGTLLCLICHSCVVGAEASPSTSTDSDDGAVVQEETKSDTSDHELYEAIKNGEIEGVKSRINASKMDLNKPLAAKLTLTPNITFKDPIQIDVNPYTPLGLAVLHNKTDIVQFLLEQPNLDVNAKSMRTQKTALHIAAQEGHLECLIALLQQPRIKKNIRTRTTKRTPLFFASEKGHLDCVMKLHEQGADINFPNAAGITPLGAAEHRGHVAVVQFLDQHGAERGESAAIYKAIEKKTTPEDN